MRKTITARRFNRYLIKADRQKQIYTQAAGIVIQMRQEAGLTQQQLADKIGTTQACISRLEDPKCRTHKINTLLRIATALDRELTLSVAPKIIVDTSDT